MATASTTVRGQALRDKVLRTALELFTAHGYFNTSIHDIRRVADVSIGSIYHHFANKESLAKALYDSLLDHMAKEIEYANNHHHSCHDRCRAIVEFLYEATEKEPATVEFVIYAKHREFMPSEPPICSSRPFGMMRAIVAAGIDAGEIRPVEPWVASTALFGGPIRLMQLRLDGVLENPLSTYLEESWDCAWRSVAA